jgi:hypothetical protein
VDILQYRTSVREMSRIEPRIVITGCTVQTVVVLYLFAGLLEALGIALVAVELWEANRRWRAFMLRPRTIILSDTARAFDQAMPIGAVGGDRTTETRLAQLEDAMHAHKVEHADHEVAAWRYAKQVAEESADLVEQRLTPELQTLLGYLIGREERPRWRPWWLGPVLLSVGLVLGTLGNIVAGAQ